MSHEHSLFHIIELFPLLLSGVVLLMCFSADYFMKEVITRMIALSTVIFIVVQLLWWWLHFIEGINSMPSEVHITWSVFDTLVMFIFIHLLRRKP